MKEWDNERSKKFLRSLDRSLKQEVRDHLKKYPGDDESKKQIDEIRDKLRKITMTKKRTSEIRGFWREFKGNNGHGDWKKLADQMEEFLGNKTGSDNTGLEEFDEDELKLITVEFVS